MVAMVSGAAWSGVYLCLPVPAAYRRWGNTSRTLEEASDTTTVATAAGTLCCPAVTTAVLSVERMTSIPIVKGNVSAPRHIQIVY